MEKPPVEQTSTWRARLIDSWISLANRCQASSFDGSRELFACQFSLKWRRFRFWLACASRELVIWIILPIMQAIHLWFPIIECYLSPGRCSAMEILRCRRLWSRRRNLHERCLRRKIDERKVVVKLNGRSCLRRRGVVTTFSAIATLSLESARCRPEKHNFVNLSCRKMIGESGAKTETVANRFEFKFNWPQKHQQRQDGHLKKSFLIQIEWNFNVRRPTIVERDESLRKIEN